MFPRSILIPAITLLSVLAITVLAYGMNMQILLVGMVAFAPLVFLFNNPDRTFFLCTALYFSGLTLPGIPQRGDLSLVLTMICIAAMIATNITLHRKVLSQPQSGWILAFIAVLGVHMYFRGFGLRVFGGESWGGFNYVAMLIASFFFMVTGYVYLTERQWQRALLLMCTLSILPTLAQAVFALSGGSIYQLFYIIVPESQVLNFMQDRAAGTGMARLQQANIASQYYWIMALLLISQRKNRFLVFVLIALSSFLSGVSGNRISFVFNLLVAAFYLLTHPRLRFSQIISHPGTLAAGLALLILIPLTPYLPLPFQRILSILPFAEISWEAKLSASSTIGWRYEVWEAALRQLPEYLLLGKGFAFSAQDIMTISARTLQMNDIEYVLASRNYHNGLIHTLLDLGLFGLLTTLGFMVAVFRRQFRQVRRTWHNPRLQHYHHVVFAVYLATVLVYFVMAGGVTHLALIFFWVIVLEGLARSDRREQNHADARAEAAPDPRALSPKLRPLRPLPIR